MSAFEKPPIVFLFTFQKPKHFQSGRGGVKVILKPCGGFDPSSILGPGPIYFSYIILIWLKYECLFLKKQS